MKRRFGGRNHVLSGSLKKRPILHISILIVIIDITNIFLKLNLVLAPFLKQRMKLKTRLSSSSLPSSPRILNYLRLTLLFLTMFLLWLMIRIMGTLTNFPLLRKLKRQFSFLARTALHLRWVVWHFFHSLLVHSFFRCCSSYEGFLSLYTST